MRNTRILFVLALFLLQVLRPGLPLLAAEVDVIVETPRVDGLDGDGTWPRVDAAAFEADFISLAATDGRYVFVDTTKLAPRAGQGRWVYDLYTKSAFRVEPSITYLAAQNLLVLGWRSTPSKTAEIVLQSLADLVPSAPVPAPPAGPISYFAETGHTLGGVFKSYWEQNGGLPVFGYPNTEELRQYNDDMKTFYQVQYFERQRYEHHPEHAGTVYEVLLGRLGAETLARQGRPWEQLPKGSPAAPHYFAATGHAIAPEFWGYWSSHGLEFDGRAGTSFEESLALFGYPISEPAMEINSSGDRVLTQWFERARFEYHPNNPEAYKVLLGRLAADIVAVSWP